MRLETGDGKRGVVHYHHAQHFLRELSCELERTGLGMDWRRVCCRRRLQEKYNMLSALRVVGGVKIIDGVELRRGVKCS